MAKFLNWGSQDGSNRYDGRKPYPHPHVICVKCKKIVDPDIPGLDAFKNKVAAETQFQILTQRLDFFGICSQVHGRKKLISFFCL